MPRSWCHPGLHHLGGTVMTRSFGLALFSSTLALCAAISASAAQPGDPPPGIAKIETVVVIFAENRAFDNLYGHFPGADGIDKASEESLRQRDRDGSVLSELPPVWDGLTAKGVTPPVTQAMTEHLANQPFTVNDAKGFNVPLTVVTHDLWHRYYQNQMQINGGKNDMFVAWGDSGAMPMSNWDTSKGDMWAVAQKYVLADHFFMGGFGGSFFNHQWLICACAPYYANADKSPAKPSIAVTDDSGTALKIADNSPKSARDGIPKFVSDGNLTPDFRSEESRV
ncbi:acid phosphatase, partial [Mesorhizobium sp. M00.F.Ca.ET.149.01.1.1]